jgi:RNA polymerase sigma factor (sigma-70 family)
VAASPYKRKTDAELVNMCLEGDGRAWEALIKRYRRYIYAIPMKFGLKRADSADVFQNVCLVLLEHLQELKDEKRIIGWLGTTTARFCLLATGDNQREIPTPDEEFEEPLDPSLNLEEIRLLTEAQQDLRDCVRKLRPRCRDLLEMLYFDQTKPSYQEISDAMDIPVGAISPSRNRCLEQLRTILRRRGIK